MPAQARLGLDPAFVVGEVNRRIFGSFVEHMGRCVYTGIYEPDHPTADADGFRGDVAALVAELGVSVVRYPGGNFVSNYVWENGVGPRAERPATLDLAWKSIEPNQVGTDDFLQWCERVDLEPMLAVNLGTRGLPEALNLLEYVNAPAGTQLADQRVKNGRTEPYGVRTWCLGNEMDGPWQIGHKTAEEYARLAEETAKAMLRVDRDLSLVACGSSNSAMPTFGAWEAAVLERCFDVVDLISAHAYYEPIGDDQASFLASADNMDRFITSVVATADHVAATKKSGKRIMISFDEWNVWYASRFPGENNLEFRPTGSLIEDVYDVHDAVVVGSLLITLLKHVDRVGAACLAQLVNVIAPIMTQAGGPAWRQTIFHPFALTARHARGTVLQTPVAVPSFTTDRYGEVDQVLSVATHDQQSGDLVIFAVNRSLTESADLVALVDRFPGLVLTEHLVINDDDPYATNTADQPDRVQPQRGTSDLTDQRLTAQLPPVSWHCIRLTGGTQR